MRDRKKPSPKSRLNKGCKALPAIQFTRPATLLLPRLPLILG